MKNLILVSVLIAGPAAARCTAFLVPPTARITVDEYGNDVWRKDRADEVVGFPAKKFTAGNPILIKSGFDQTLASCDPAGFVFDKKTALMKLWIRKDKNDFEAVWAKKEQLIDFSYEYHNSPSSFENVAAIEHAALLFKDRQQNANFKAPEIENQRTFPEDFDKVWSALVETLSDQQWPLETIDKASGLVTTKTMTDSRGETMVCATKFDEAHRTSLNLFVKKTESGTRVKVNATFRAMREDQAITCYSSGAIEKSLFDGIKKNL